MANKNETEPILDLETLVKRPKVRINNVEYEIRSPDEISILEAARIASLGNRLDELGSLTEFTTAEEKEFTAVLQLIFDKVNVTIPKDLNPPLTDDHKLSVIEFFTSLLPEVATGQKMMSQSTGEKQPHNFNASTAERP